MQGSDLKKREVDVLDMLEGSHGCAPYKTTYWLADIAKLSSNGLGHIAHGLICFRARSTQGGGAAI